MADLSEFPLRINLILSTLSGKPLKFKKIRSIDEEPGLKNKIYEMDSKSFFLANESTNQIIAALNDLDDQDFKIICTASILYLKDNNKLEKISKLNETLVKVKSCKEATKWLLTSLITFLKHKSNENMVFNEYVKLGLRENKAKILKKLWEEEKKRLQENLNNQQYSFMSSQLIDMDWKFGVTSCTSELYKIGNPFLQLKLVLNVGGKLETHFMDMTLQTFYSFLHEMNKAKSQMEYLS